MGRITPVVLSVWVVLAFSIAGVGGVGATGTDLAPTQSADSLSEAGSMPADTNETNDTTETTEGNESLAPGARLAGVIGVGQAEVQGEVENRAFGLSIAATRSNGSKARLLANETERLTERVRDLENRTAELNESYEAGEISFGAYQARLAKLTAQTRMLERLANRSVATASALPAETRQAHGVNVTQLYRVRSQATNMTRKHLSKAARQIGGPRVGHPLGKERGPPEDRPGAGPPGDQPGADGPGTGGQNMTSEGAPANGSMGPPNGSAPPHNGSQNPSNGSAPPHNGSQNPSNGSAPPHNGSQGLPNGSTLPQNGSAQ